MFAWSIQKVYDQNKYKFKYLISLTNKTQIVLSFLWTINFNSVMYLNLIEKTNVLI